MNRKHTYADFKAQLDYLRSRDPLFSISTDIIVGFPGETLEEFEATARAMRECEFDFAYVARYSERNGTVASKLGDDISASEKARRWSVLNDILRDSVRNRNLLMVGRREEVMISGTGPEGIWVGRTRNFKEVHLPRNPDLRIGMIVVADITDLDGWALRGALATPVP
jgi:tRNA-2-methylthio-N6-dimethylallyladenosine synthase